VRVDDEGSDDQSPATARAVPVAVDIAAVSLAVASTLLAEAGSDERRSVQP